MSTYDRPGDPPPEGHRYAGLVVDVSDTGREALLAALSRARFSGWVGPAEGRWAVAVVDDPEGSVAGSRTGVPGLARRIADGLGTLAVGVEVDDARVLRLTWIRPEGDGAYDSDPSVGHEEEDDDDLDDSPVGVELLDELAAACGRPEVAEDLAELLGERIDRDSTFEPSACAPPCGCSGCRPGWSRPAPCRATSRAGPADARRPGWERAAPGPPGACRGRRCAACGAAASRARGEGSQAADQNA